MATFLIACGGTGGHLSPGIALAEGLRAKGHRPVLIISRKKVDARLMEKYPQFETIRMHGSPLVWRPRALLQFMVSQTQATCAGIRLIGRLEPRAVFGFGGFTTAGVMLAAWLRRVPIALHEANRVPGRAVRLFARLARRVWLPPEVSLPRVNVGKLRFTGLPVRAEIVRKDRAAACAALGLDPRFPVVVIFGGSQGAAPLNAWAEKETRSLIEAGIQVYCVTGAARENEAPRPRTDPAAAERACVVYVPFCDRVADLLSAADLVVGRAGAGTIAECLRCRAPVILVPYPLAADDHQRANAEWLARRGGGICLPQERLGELTPLVREWLAAPERLENIRKNQARIDDGRGLDELIADLEALSK